MYTMLQSDWFRTSPAPTGGRCSKAPWRGSHCGAFLMYRYQEQKQDPVAVFDGWADETSNVQTL